MGKAVGDDPRHFAGLARSRTFERFVMSFGSAFEGPCKGAMAVCTPANA